MYNNKLAVALKSNGKVLREFGETVYVPFGSEYSILIKNLNSVRALVTVTVDGTDAGDGTQFVIDPNNDLELERFINNGNMDTGNKFKFIERTDRVENHRGVGIEDGLVRIEFQFEKPAVVPNIPDIWYYHDVYYNYRPWRLEQTFTGAPTITCNVGDDVNGNVLRSMNASYSASVGSNEPVVNVNYSAEVQSFVDNEAGITVPGSISDQKFRTVSSFPVEDETHVIVLQMLGETENKKVVKPVTVKAKPKCETCGKTNKATAKFCTECGTSLTIV